MANRRWCAGRGVVTQLGLNRILLPFFGEKVADRPDEGHRGGTANDAFNEAESLPTMGGPLVPGGRGTGSISRAGAVPRTERQ